MLEIKNKIKKILPNIDDETLDKVVNLVNVCGLTELEELDRVEERDLEDFLKPIQIRKLLRVFKKIVNMFLFFIFSNIIQMQFYDCDKKCSAA